MSVKRQDVCACKVGCIVSLSVALLESLLFKKQCRRVANCKHRGDHHTMPSCQKLHHTLSTASTRADGA